MGVYLLANKNSNNTTVSVDDVRKYVEEVSEIDTAIKKAKAELKSTMDEDDKIDELKGDIKKAREKLKSYVENHGVYKEYNKKVQELKDDKKDIISDAKDNGIPKKEIDVAVKMLKSDIDPDSATEIYANIADLIE